MKKQVQFSSDTVFNEKKSKAIHPETSFQERKWREKEKDFKKGKFEAYEQKILMDSLCDYAKANGLGEADLQDFIKLSNKETSGVWTKIAEKIPWRSVQSSHNFIKRNFNDNNYKGRWTQGEIDKLVKLVTKFGKKWTLISQELDRTPNNVRDKYKELGAENHEERKKGIWAIKEISQLLKLVESNVGIKFLDVAIDQYVNRKSKSHDEISEMSELTEGAAKSFNSINFRNQIPSR